MDEARNCNKMTYQTEIQVTCHRANNMAYLCHMRTTVELPDELMVRAKLNATESGLSLKEFFIAAIENKLASRPNKIRRSPPQIGSPDSPAVGVLTPDQIDQVMFGQ